MTERQTKNRRKYLTKYYKTDRQTGRKDVRQSILMPPKLTDRQRKNRNKYVLEYSMADRQTKNIRKHV